MNDIINLFGNKCNYHHDTCRSIATRISELHKTGGKINNNFFSQYLSFINNNQQYYYERCIGRKDIYMPVMKQILTYLTPTQHDMSNMATFRKSTDQVAHSSDHIIELFKILIDREIEICPVVLETSLLGKNIQLAEYLISYVVPDEKCLEAACLCLDSQNLIKSMVFQKVEITEKAIINAIRMKNNDILDILLQTGYVPCIKCLIESCKIVHEKIITKILFYKITPTKDCFNALLQSAFLSHYKNKECSDAPTIAILIDILIKYGYQLTYDDVYNAMTVGCYINNIKQYDIKMDNKFIEECTRLGYYPYPELNIMPTMNCLYIECSRPGNVPIIKKLIARGLTPNVECLKQACANKSNIKNITFLIETHKIKPDIDCLKEIAKQLGNSTLTYLLDHYSNETVEITPDASDEDFKDQKSEKSEKYNVINIDNKVRLIDKKNKYELTTLATNIFGFEKDTTMTFFEARKYIITYITKNKLLADKQKDIIKLDQVLCRLLLIKPRKGSIKYVEFDDIDNIACAMLAV